MNHISDDLYYDVYIPALLLLAKRNNSEANSVANLNFNSYDEKLKGKVIILSFDCLVCNNLIQMPEYNPDNDEGVQIIRNHLVDHLKQKNLLPFV